MLAVIAKLNVKEGKEAEFEPVMLELAAQVRANEVVHHALAKFFFQVEDVKRDAKVATHPAGILDVARTTAPTADRSSRSRGVV